MTEAQQATTTAAKAFAAALAQLPSEQHPAWLAYFGEVLEKTKGESALQDLLSVICERLHHGEW